MLSFLLSISEEKNHSKIKQLYYKYHMDMVRFAIRRLKQNGISNYEIDAEEVVQNAFEKIIKYIDAIDFSVAEKAMKSYVLSIVSNEIINLLSSYSYYDNIDDYKDILEDEDLIEKINITESYNEVVKIMEQLDERYGTILMYYFCCEMSVKEIASMLCLSKKTIYTRLQRGKLILLKRLNEVQHYEEKP